MMVVLASGLLTLQSVPPAAGTAHPLQPRTGPGTWITDDDYPAESLRNKQFGIVEFRVDVGPQGDLTACRILVSSGFWRLDQQTCALIMKRARFKAARDAAGQPIPATFQSRFRWILPSSKQDYDRLAQEMASVMDLTISLNRLPADYRQPASIRVRFDGNGKVSDCAVEAGSGNGTLDKLAFQQARNDLARPPFREGLATQPDTRMARVVFIADNKAK